MAGMIYAMLWSRTIVFQKRFFFAPEFSFFFVHAFRAGKTKQAIMGMIFSVTYALTTIIVGIILQLQYGSWYCYDWNASLASMETPCKGNISTEAVFTTWLRAWPFIIVNLLALLITVLSHTMLYKEIHVQMIKVAP
jgi:hypothetical protein